MLEPLEVDNVLGALGLAKADEEGTVQLGALDRQVSRRQIRRGGVD